MKNHSDKMKIVYTFFFLLIIPLILISFIIVKILISLFSIYEIFIGLGVIILLTLLIIIKGIFSKNKKEHKENFNSEDSLLLLAIFVGNTSNGIDLKTIHHNCDFLDRSYIDFKKLNESTTNLLEIGFIIFKNKKYYLTKKFHQYFNESFENEKNPWKQKEIIYNLLNSLNFEKSDMEKMDYFTNEEYDSSIKEYISLMDEKINKINNNIK